MLGHSQGHLTFHPLQASTSAAGVTIAAKGSTPEVPLSPSSSSPPAEERGPDASEIGSRGSGLAVDHLVSAALPPGSGWSEGVGRCLPQGQTPLGEGGWFRPVPVDWPGVGAVRTVPGGYLPAERKGLPPPLAKWEAGSLLFSLSALLHSPHD